MEPDAPPPRRDHLPGSASPTVIAGVTLLLYGLVAWPLHQTLHQTGSVASAPLLGLQPVILASLLLCAALVALSTIDALTFRLPDILTLPLTAAGLLLQPTLERGLAAAAGFAALAGTAWLYQAWRGRAGLGLGDAKLFAAAGAWLGVEALATVLAYAAGAALASVFARAGVAWARTGARTGQPGLTLSTRMPFGPYLAFAIWLVWLYGPISVAAE